MPRRHRPQRAIPKAYVIHREDLDPADVTSIEGIPVVKLTRALCQCAQEHLGRDLLEQAVRQGRARGRGVAMELRAGEKARATGDVDLVLRGDPESLLEHLDASLAEDYEGFSFERNEPQPLELRPHVRRTRVKVAFRTKPFMTLVVEIAPVEAGGDEIEEIAAHDLSTIGLEGPDVIPVLAVRWQIAQKLHAITEPPLRPGGENARYWDLIDLQLLQALTGENLAPVKDACQRIFAARAQQPWPPYITSYADWSDQYAAMASSLGMPITDLNEAVEVVHALIHAIDTS